MSSPRAITIGTMEQRTHFRLSPVDVTGRTVSVKIAFSQFTLPARLPAGFVSIEGRVVLSGDAKARVTKTGILGTVEGIKHWYVTTTAGFALIHAGGTVQISSANRTGRVAQQLERVMPGISNAPSHITKLDTRLRISQAINAAAFVNAFTLVLRSKGSISYEPELSPMIEIKWTSPAMTLRIGITGVIQAFGVKKPLDAQKVCAEIFEKTVAIADVFKREVTTNGRTGGFAEGFRASRTKENKARDKLNSRYPRVRGYNHVPGPNQYVRPGPNGKARLYTVKGNMSLSAKKIRKAYETAGVNMPPYLKNMLGGAFVFYGASKGAERAASWTATKNGYYVAPGPGKQPHFYKLPKNLRAGYETAKKRYTSANIAMPVHIRRNIFGRNGNGSPVAAAGPVRHTVSGNNKVNGKSYKKLTTAQLVAVARNLGNAGAKNKMSKEVLYGRIKTRANVRATSPVRASNVTVNGRMYTFTNGDNQQIIRNGRRRVFSTLEKAEREAVARAYLGNVKNIPVSTWYAAMKAAKR